MGKLDWSSPRTLARGLSKEAPDCSRDSSKCRKTRGKRYLLLEILLHWSGPSPLLQSFGWLEKWCVIAPSNGSSWPPPGWPLPVLERLRLQCIHSPYCSFRERPILDHSLIDLPWSIWSHSRYVTCKQLPGDAIQLHAKKSFHWPFPLIQPL